VMRTLATFRVVPPPGARADRVTTVLGIQPTTVHEVGELVGRRSPRVVQAAMWSLDSAVDVGDGVELGTSLTVLLDRLEPLTGRLWDLYADGHMFDWFCFVGSHATEHAVELDRPVLARLITLPGDLLLDVYPDDKDAE